MGDMGNLTINWQWFHRGVHW